MEGGSCVLGVVGGVCESRDFSCWDQSFEVNLKSWGTLPRRSHLLWLVRKRFLATSMLLSEYDTFQSHRLMSVCASVGARRGRSKYSLRSGGDHLSAEQISDCLWVVVEVSLVLWPKEHCLDGDLFLVREDLLPGV